MTSPSFEQRQKAGGGGSIYDLGYRGYEGPRLGRRAAVAALLVHSWRTAYGLGRSARSKIAPVGLVLLAVLPALLAIGVLVLFAQFAPALEASEAIEALQPIRYATIFPFTATFVFLFSAAQAPELFGRDQLTGTLPLYFSRAVGRLDYALARLLGLFLALAFMIFAPQVILLLGRVLVADDLGSGIGEELSAVPALLAVGIIVTAVVGTISAAIAALTPRRAYATVAIVVVFLVPRLLAESLVLLDSELPGQLAVLLSPSDVLDGVNAYVFGVAPELPAPRSAGLDLWVYLPAAAAWFMGSLAVLLLRYRRIET
jgi:ABC-2 type transport system permease protein